MSEKLDIDSAKAEIERLTEALKSIASKSSCECWSVPGMGSGLPHTWKGCQAHRSADPDEWCLCCIAHAALAPKGVSSAETRTEHKDECRAALKEIAEELSQSNGGKGPSFPLNLHILKLAHEALKKSEIGSTNLNPNPIQDI